MFLPRYGDSVLPQAWLVEPGATTLPVPEPTYIWSSAGVGGLGEGQST